MPANNRTFIVFDFETDSPDSTKANPVQIAAVAVHSKKLEIIKDSEFNMFCRPEGIDEPSYKEEHWETIKWHAQLKKASPEDILEQWKTYPQTKLAWDNFHEYINRHNWKKKGFTAPIPVGANIEGFDLPIHKRLDEKYKKKNPWWLRDATCVQKLSFFWMESLSNGPANYKMDTLRELFGIPMDNAHDALNDVKVEAEIFIKYMKLHRKCVDQIEFFRNLK